MKQESISAYDYIKKAYTVYGKELMFSGYQQGRMFCDKYDGLKISYRHYIQALWEQPNQKIKVQAVLGDAMKKYHFHSDGGGEEVIYSLANDYKCVEVQGNSGAQTMSINMKGSAGRYVECKLKDEIKQQLNDLMPLVPDEISVTNFKEKRYIPTPIPLGLIAGSGIGMGVGMRNNLPAFTASSLYEAYIKNDYKLLRPNFGYSLGNCWDGVSSFDNTKNKIIGKDLSKQKPTEENIEGLKDLWETGEGTLTLGIPMYKCKINNVEGLMLVCDPKLFAPDVNEKEEKESKNGKKKKPVKQTQLVMWKKEGLVETFDYTDDIGKLFISLTPRTKKITLEDVRKEVYEHCKMFQTIKYQVNISTGDITGKVGIGNWIDFTHNNYCKLYKRFISSELERLDNEEIAWYNYRAIVDRLTDKKRDWSDKEIMEDINAKLLKGTAKDKKHLLRIEHVEWVGAKANNAIRNTKPEKKLEAIEKEKERYKNMVIEDQVKNFVDCWSNL